MTEKTRGANRPTILRRLLPIVAILLLAAVLVTPVAAEPVSVATLADLQNNIRLGNSVILDDDISITSSSDTITIDSGKDITIIGNGHYINRSASGDFFLITVSSGKLTLEGGNGGLFVHGKNESYSGQKYGLILVTGDGSELVMKDGVTLQNSSVITGSKTDYGGDARKPGETGTTGAEHVGGAVQVLRNAEFLMEGGTITQNTAWIGGGVWIRYGGNFTMTGGQISGNKAGDDALNGGFAGAVQVEDTGYAKICGDAVISGNSGRQTGGIQNSGTLVICGSAQIVNNNATKNTGGGIYNAGTLTISDEVTISGNTAQSSGGGISISNTGTLTISDEVTISGNTAVGWGGGIMNTGTLTISDEVTISGNTVYQDTDNKNGIGGGIENQGTLVISDRVTITGNEAKGSGGGIYNFQTLTIGEADNPGMVTISGNTAHGFGGGIVNSGTLTITNTEISDNTVKEMWDEVNKEWDSWGGAIQIEGKTTLFGTVTITGNKANDGGAINLVKADEDSELLLSGKLIIAGNTELDGTTENNIRYHQTEHETYGYKVPKINGILAEGSNIGVKPDGTPTYGTPILVTTPYTGENYGRYFFSDADPDKINYVIEGVAGDDGKITLQMTMQSYNIRNGEIENGTVLTPAKAKIGEPVTIIFSPNDGYTLDGVSVKDAEGNDVTVDEGVFEMPASDVTITATFVPKAYSIKAGNLPHGYITEPADAYVDSEVTVSINADTGYEVDPASITVTTDGGKPVTVTNGKFIMPADNVTISADFTKITYTITASSSEGGSITLDKYSAQVGDIITVTPTPETDYVLENLTVTYLGGSKATVGNPFTMETPITEIKAYFSKDVFAITAETTPASSGTITITNTTAGNEITSAKGGYSISIAANPAPGYELNGEITVKKTSNSEQITVTDGKFTMPEEAVTVSASFKQADYTLPTSVTVEHGTATITATTAKYGDPVSVTTTAEEGYIFSRLIIDPASGSDITVFETSFTMPASNVNAITAYFVPKTYTIDVSHAANGTISVTPASATMGTAVTFLATPKEGYAFAKFNITDENGVHITYLIANPATNYQMPANNITVTLEVTPLTYTIALDESIATITLTPAQFTAKTGAEISVTATAKAGQTVGSIQILKKDGTLHATIAGTSGSFEMPGSDATIKAIAAPAPAPAPQEPEKEPSSQGTSTWMEIIQPTDTPTDEPTETPTETPTDNNPSQPGDSDNGGGVPVAAVAGGIAVVAVAGIGLGIFLRRR